MSISGAMRVGEWVEVRPLAEILATLDGQGRLDGMPFMPEMAAQCGTRFPIFRSAHKTCDPTGGATHLRRIKDAVHGATRCNGAAHGGCEARCLLFWKTAWLRPVDGPGPLKPPATPNPDLAVLFDNVSAAAADGEARYRCQATEIGRASTPLSAAPARPLYRRRQERQRKRGPCREPCVRRGRRRRAGETVASHFDTPGRDAGETAAAGGRRRRSASCRARSSRCARRRRSWRR